MHLSSNLVWQSNYTCRWHSSFSQRVQTMKKSDTWFRFIIRNIYNLLIFGGIIFSSYLVGKYTFERVVSVDSHLRWVKQITKRRKIIWILLRSLPSKQSFKKRFSNGIISWQPSECSKLCHQSCSFFCEWCRTYIISFSKYAKF